MITVFDIVTTPMFRDFRIVSGKRGMHNPVSGTGLLDWESGDAIRRSFHRGDFVLTTLVADRENPRGANQCVVSLLRNGVSAVCIKDVFFRDLAEETLRLSDQLGIPVFFFSDTFIDDIVYEVRSLLKEDIGTLRENLGGLLESAFDAWHDAGAAAGETESALQSMLGPYLHGFYLCGAVFPRDGASLDPVLPSPKGGGREAFLPVPYRQGLILFLSSPRQEDLTPVDLAARLEVLGAGGRRLCFGAGKVRQDRDGISPAILEAVQACAADALRERAGPPGGPDREGSLDSLLAGNFWTRPTKTFFRERYRILKAYDLDHSTDFLATLAAYIEADGDLNAASRQVFQHPNTIRYRIGKIKTLLGLEGPGSYAELVFFGKMCRLQWFYEEVLGIRTGNG